MPILLASLQHSSTRMLPNPFPRHGLAMARERTSARFSQITASAAQPMNSPPPVSRMRKSRLAAWWFERTRQQQALRRTFHEQTVDLLRIAHPRGAQDWLHDTTLLSKKRFNKKERPSSRNKLRRMAPSTGLSRSGSDSRPLCRFTLALSPPKPLRTRTSPLFRLKLSVMIYLFFCRQPQQLASSIPLFLAGWGNDTPWDNSGLRALPCALLREG